MDIAGHIEAYFARRAMKRALAKRPVDVVENAVVKLVGRIVPAQARVPSAASCELCAWFVCVVEQSRGKRGMVEVRREQSEGVLRVDCGGEVVEIDASSSRLLSARWRTVENPAGLSFDNRYREVVLQPGETIAAHGRARRIGGVLVLAADSISANPTLF